MCCQQCSRERERVSGVAEMCNCLCVGLLWWRIKVNPHRIVVWWLLFGCDYHLILQRFYQPRSATTPLGQRAGHSAGHGVVRESRSIKLLESVGQVAANKRGLHS